MEKASITLRGTDKDWVASASRDELLATLGEAAEMQRHVDRIVTTCRVELARRRDEGCGHAAADEAVVNEATGVSRQQGRKHERRAGVADRVPSAANALAGGKIGGEHLDAVARAVPDELLDELEADGPGLFADAAHQSPDQFRKELDWWVRDKERELGISRAERQRRARTGRCGVDVATGMIALSAQLDPVRGAKVQHRVRLEYRRLLRLDQEAATAGSAHPEADPDRTVDQRWCDAIANAVVSGPSGGSRSGDDRLPVVGIDLGVLAGLTDQGTCEIPGVDEIPAEVGRYMACDQPVLVLSLDPTGVPVAMTHFHRHASRDQRRALEVLHGGCVGPDCDVSMADCHIHHTVPWSTRPVTDLRELAPLCTRHHHLAHEAGWKLEVGGDGEIIWTAPDGKVHRREPRRRARPPNSSVGGDEGRGAEPSSSGRDVRGGD